MGAAGAKTLIMSSVLLAGCATTTALDRSLLDQGAALTVVQQEMVLSNLELFRQRPHALPWHLKITSGSVTVNDTISSTESVVWSPVARTLGITPSRSVQLQWNIVPVTDNSELTALTGLYKGNVLDERSEDPNILPPTCLNKDGSSRYFNQTFDEGTTPPTDHPYGTFNQTFISVKQSPDAEDCFDQIVKVTLDSAPVNLQDRGLTVPAAAVMQNRR